jgi:hypothetical protein
VSKATDTRLAVLKVLAGQSPGYFIYPNAAAFTGEGLDPGEVAEVLDELHREGALERELIAASPDNAEENGELEGVPGGYRLTTEPSNEEASR